ncbi:MAG: hypothetical protein ACRDI0_07020 [Actinomycetota bacterium]
MSRQATTLAALAAIAAAGAALSAGAWLLLWRQWRARRRRHAGDLTREGSSSRNDDGKEAD